MSKFFLKKQSNKTKQNDNKIRKLIDQYSKVQKIFERKCCKYFSLPKSFLKKKKKKKTNFN